MSSPKTETTAYSETRSPRHNCQIFLAYHKPAVFIQNEYMHPIHVGASLSKLNICETQDDSGTDQISAKNDTHCELTAQYWTWKNCHADYIGFMHYRRHLIFELDPASAFKEDIYGVVYFENINEKYIDAAKLTPQGVDSVLDEYELVLPKKWDVRNAGSKNLYDHYKSSSPYLHISDYDKALQIMGELYPEYKETAEEYNTGHLGYFTNMFVMKRELFNEYCTWLFAILGTLETQVDISGYNPQERRIFGYISEWLFGIFVTHLQKQNKYKYVELQRTFLENTSIKNSTAIPVDIIGTCASSDIFYNPNLKEKTEQDGIIRIGYYGQRQSIFSMMQPALNVSANTFSYDTNAAKDMMLGILNKTIFEKIEKSSANFLLIDLLAERFDIAIADEFVMDSNETVEKSGFLNGKNVAIKKRIEWISGNFEEYKKIIAEFSEKIKKKYATEKIIVYHAYCVERYLNKDGDIVWFDAETLEFIRYSNFILDWVYSVLLENLGDCVVVEMSDETIGDEKSSWGLSMTHYTLDAYHVLYNRIIEIIKETEKRKADEIQKIERDAALKAKKGRDEIVEREKKEAEERNATKSRMNASAVQPVFSGKSIAVCVAFNDAFAPYAAVLIKSIVNASTNANNYDIVILHTDVSTENQKRFQFMIKEKKNFSIRFIETAPFFLGLNLPTHMHFGKEIYYRLRIPTIFANYEKVVYLDADTVVLRDVADLHNANLSNKYFAAVPDYCMKGFRKLKIRSLRETGGFESEKYLTNYVGIKNPENYFQSGVMVFNVAVLKAENVEEKLLKLLNGKVYWFPDQDIMNLVAEGRTLPLDYNWNVLHGNGDVNSFYVQLPAGVFDKYVESRKNPFIIHYAGDKKPWKVVDVDFSEEFWGIAYTTPWGKEMRSLHSELEKGREEKKLTPEERLLVYHKISKDPFISAYRKIRRSFGLWQHDTNSGTTEEKIAAHHKISKDKLITLYRKIRRALGAWNYRI
jgi:lipopolysaccharide biosynthesis glycosyltransferase